MKHIHIPTIDELMAPDTVHGMLFGDSNVLKYFDLETKATKTLSEVNAQKIHAVVTSKEEVCYGGDSRIYFLFGKQNIRRTNIVNCIHETNENLLDGGAYGLYNTLEDKAVISEMEINLKYVIVIKSLATDEQKNTYCLVQLADNKQSFVSIDSLKKPIIQYNTDHRKVCQAIIVPYGSFKGLDGKKYPFSVISSANLDCLDINGKKIKKNEIVDSEISQITLLKQHGSIIEIAYSGVRLEQITKATIDLDKRQVLQETPLVPELSDYVLALHPVKNLSLHERLMDLRE